MISLSKFRDKLLVSFGVFTLLILLNLVINDNAEQRPFKTENFVTLEIITFEEIEICDENGCRGIETQIPEMSVGQASGLIFKSVGDKSFVLTADHFCEFFMYDSVDLRSLTLQMGSMLNVYDFYENEMKGEIVYRDPTTDLCIVSVDRQDVKDVRLAKTMPQEGERVYVVSAPLGMSGEGYALHFEGIFSGCNSNIECFYSIPARPGSSGSIIVNKKGEMIGMVQRAHPMMHFLALGVSRDTLFVFLYEASEATGINLL